MLNYIWGGLIVFSFVFAIISDVRDLAQDTYRNAQPLPVTLAFPEGYSPDVRRVPVEVRIDSAAYGAFYGVEAPPALAYSGVIVQTQDGRQLRFAQDADVPEPLATIRQMTSARDNDLRGVVQLEAAPGAQAAQAAVRFEAVRFVKMNAIAQAAIDFAETAVTISLGLIGVLALWLGLMQIGEASGLVYKLVRLVQPLLRPLFPGIPKDHPAMGMVALNLTANVLGLSNAATPFGIKAMEELQTLNASEDTATDEMVMLLAMNTASVQLVPPSLLVAVMGLQINELIFAIIIVTGLSLAVAITAAKLYGRLARYRATDPNGPGRGERERRERRREGEKEKRRREKRKT